jgi:hypothetical protein
LQPRQSIGHYRVVHLIGPRWVLFLRRIGWAPE